MTQEEIDAAAKHGEEIGRIKTTQENHDRRLDKMETLMTRWQSGAIGFLVTVFGLYTKGLGLW